MNKALILIVDDNQNNLNLLDSVLKDEIYNLAFTQEAKSALAFIEEKKPDLILLDIMMPSMDGFEACRILKSNEYTKNIPVIFLTAKTSNEDIIKGFDVGGIDYIKKPFNARELRTRIRTHLNLKFTTDLLAEKNHQLEKALAELEKANHAKDQFLSIIAHDLKNPLGSVISIAELLQNDAISRTQKDKLITAIHTSGSQGFDLVNSLLTWSRSQRGHIQQNKVVLKLNAMIENVISLLNTQIISKNLTLNINIDDTSTVYADMHMIDTILRNLISNAIKFSHHSGIITIKTHLENTNTIICIKDEGVGISSEKIKTLFDIDVKNVTVGTRGERGTGLGLILADEFIKKNNGKIWVESEPGKSSTFFIQLPTTEDSF